jgi:hypothetical protein
MRILLLIICCLTIQLSIAQNYSYKTNSTEGRFSLAFPIEPNVEKKEIGGFTTVLYTGLLNKSVFLFSYSNIPVSDGEIDEILKSTQNGFMESVEMVPNNNRTITKGKIPGLYCEGTAENGLAVSYEVYYHKNILYQIGVMSQGTPDVKSMKTFSQKLKIKK